MVAEQLGVYYGRIEAVTVLGAALKKYYAALIVAGLDYPYCALE